VRGSIINCYWPKGDDALHLKGDRNSGVALFMPVAYNTQSVLEIDILTLTINVSAHRAARVLHLVLSSAVVCAEFRDRFMFLRSSLTVERHVFLGLPRLLLPLDGTQFIACLANLFSGNLSMWPAKNELVVQ